MPLLIALVVGLAGGSVATFKTQKWLSPTPNGVATTAQLPATITQAKNTLSVFQVVLAVGGVFLFLNVLKLAKEALK